MAVTKIHAIKSTVNKAIDYITNPDKTEGTMLTSGYNCEPMTAHLDFKMTKTLADEVRGNVNKGNIAYHMIQSFSKFDKVTPEEAHEIGKKLTDEILEGKHEYIIATHIDKGHIHNHIIFNSISFYDYKKFRSIPYKTAQKLREISDKLCIEKGLSVINNPKGKGKSKIEWQTRKQGTSWKAKIENIIDENILKAKNYKDFVELIKREGIVIKEGKHIAFRLKGQERFTRGKTIGNEYTKEKIIERINNPDKLLDNLRNIEKLKFREKFKETKLIANALLTIRQENIKHISDFNLVEDELNKKIADIKLSMQTLEKKNEEYKNVMKYLISYKKYLPVRAKYQKSIFKKNFYKRYESEILAFEYAEKQLKKLNIDINVDTDKVIIFIKKQDEKLQELNKQFKDTRNRLNEIKKVESLIKDILKEDKEKIRVEKEKEKEI